MTTFIKQRYLEEYLTVGERSPVHLLRILLAEKMRVELVGNSPITNPQVSLFDSQ
jgi:hypothetical protein